ncbi:MAG TPA: MgtC/SapB family protein [Tahibacter sp.]|nr:MgtC/SapB family protein [Tahibacter sp.]
MTDLIWEELSAGFPDTRQFVDTTIRLVAAVILGGIVGWERERMGKAAGLRTHMLVSLGTALFVVACANSGMSSDGLSRVIQGLTTGIGFIGGGAILKLANEREIHGLTTAAGIWMTAAIGVAVGLGALGLALLATLITTATLGAIRLSTPRDERDSGKTNGNGNDA